MEKITIVSVETYKKLTPLKDKNISDSDILTAILRYQETVLRYDIGLQTYEILIDGLLNDTLTDDFKTLRNDYVIDVIVYGTAYKLADSLVYQARSNGIFKSEADNSNSINIEELRRFVNITKNDCETFIYNMISFLDKNTDKYIEYLDDKENHLTNDTKGFDFCVISPDVDYYEESVITF